VRKARVIGRPSPKIPASGSQGTESRVGCELKNGAQKGSMGIDPSENGAYPKNAEERTCGGGKAWKSSKAVDDCKDGGKDPTKGRDDPRKP